MFAVSGIRHRIILSHSGEESDKTTGRDSKSGADELTAYIIILIPFLR